MGTPGQTSTSSPAPQHSSTINPASLPGDIQGIANQLILARSLAMEEMLAYLGHELNNPLAIIQGQLFMLETKLSKVAMPEDSSVKDCIKKIEAAVDRSALLIKSARTAYKTARNDQEALIPLQTAVSHCVNICNTRFKNYKVNLLTPSSIDEGIVMDGRLGEVCTALLSLLTNGFDSVQGAKGDPWVKLELEADADQVRIIVSDSGPALPQEVVQQLFQPFFTTKDRSHHVGLGLFAAQTFAQRQKGSVSYSPRNGSCAFTLSFPRPKQK